jgi:hypothetical protein
MQPSIAPSGLDRRQDSHPPPSGGHRQRPQIGRRSDRGSITPFFVVTVIALLIGIGITVDGSGRTRAEGRAYDVAAEAARRGVQQIEEGSALLGISGTVDEAAAIAAAEDFIAAAGMSGSVRVVGNTLEVTTTTTYTPVFVDLVPGAGPVTVTGEAEAELVPGLDGEIR